MNTLHINGRDRVVDLDPGTPILWTLRDTLGLTGTKFGCGAALCGACTVHLDGQAIRSCVTPISAADGNQASSPAPKKSTRPWAGNICRCGTYARIRAAVADAAKTLAALA